MTLRLKLTLLSLVALSMVAPRGADAREIQEASKLSIPLIRSGGDDDVAGKADFKSKNGASRFQLKIKKGPPNEELELKVGGVSRGFFMTNKKGAAKVQLFGGSSLGFDPRGREIEVEDENDDKLLTSDDDGSLPFGSKVDERVNLLSTGVQPGASGHATLRVKKGRAQFNVEIEDVTDGAYDLIVDGITRGTIDVASGEGEIEFGDDSGGPPLDFDPLGKLIQVSQGGAVILTGTFLAGAPGVSVCTPGESSTALNSTDLAPGASGHVDLKIEDDCEREFEVEVEDLPVGDYDLVVAGIVRGTIPVINVTGGTQGEIEFSSDPDDPGELPLDFDPTGTTIEIKQGDNVFLTATAGAPGPGSCTVVDTEPDMTNTGADADAKGKARFRQDGDCDRNFRVEVEKLTLGNYELVVGGIVRGTIAVMLDNNEPVGHIEFDTEPDQPGEVLLTFDPRGQLVEVRQGATVFLSVTMP